MEVYISGQAGRAALPQGANIHVYSINSESFSTFPKSQANRLFMGASDVKRFKVSNEKEIIKKLNSEYKKDRCLLLTLMLLDSNEGEDIKKEAVEIVEDFLRDQVILAFLENKLFSYPLTEDCSVAKAAFFAEKKEKLTLFLEKLSLLQPHIEKVRSAWDRLHINLFDSVADKETVEKIVVEAGIFKEAVIAIESGKLSEVNKVKLQGYMNPEISKVTGYRNILGAWLNPITPDRQSIKNRNDFSKLLRAESKPQKNKSKSYHQQELSVHEAYTQTKKQIETIKDLLKELDIPKARRFTRELINFQIKNGGAEYAAISLCNIASYASDVYQRSFALELTEEAVELAPEDMLAWSALANVYVYFRRFGDARNALNNARSWGDSVHLDAIEMRILKLQNNIEEAISSYHSLLEKYKETEDHRILLLGLADCYIISKDFDTAFSLLSSAFKIAPEEPEVLCSLATFHMNIGEFDDALSLFKKATHVSLSLRASLGIGQVYQLAGDFVQAEAAFNTATEKFPKELEPYRHIAGLLRLKGETSKALKIYDFMKKEFPYDYISYIEKANTYVETGKIKKAEKEFEKVEAIQALELDVGYKVKKAQFYKDIGETKKSLQTFSQLCKEYPQSLRVKMGQANLFKELGSFDEAVRRYRSIKNKNLEYPINISLAAIYTTTGKYENALSLLPSSQPKTLQDWIAHHIRGMILLRSDKISEAISHLEYGRENTPFHSQKSYYASALAIGLIKERKYREALDSIGDAIDDTPINNVVRLHAHCKLNNSHQARDIYTVASRSSDQAVVSLAKEIGAHFSLNKSRPKHNSSWIHEQECNLLSIAVTKQAA